MPRGKHPNSLKNLRTVKPDDRAKGRPSVGLSIKEQCNALNLDRKMRQPGKLEEIAANERIEPAKRIAARRLLAALNGEIESFKALIDYTDRKPTDHTDVTSGGKPVSVYSVPAVLDDK